MKTNYKIRNFRVFGEDGANVEIAPLTILTGCNSSGKSSIAKSLLLLDSFLCKVKTDMMNKTPLMLGKYTMDFSKYPLNLLGRFDKVVNNNSNSNEVEFKYEAGEGFDVILTFSTKKSDTLNRGYLKKMVIIKGENEVFVTENGTCHLNVLPLVSQYLNEIYDYYNDPDNYWKIKNSKLSTQTIKWSIDNDSLFRVPLLDVIGRIKKEEFQQQINLILEDAFIQKSELKNLFDGIYQAFANSECETFSEFFKLREKEWLSMLSFENDESIDPQNWSAINFECTLSDSFWKFLLNKFAEGDNTFTQHIANAKISLKVLLTALINAGELISLPIEHSYSEKNRKYKEIYMPKDSVVNYYIWDDFVSWIIKHLKMAIAPLWCGNLSYVGSSRIDVKRLYTLDSDSDFATLLKHYFDARRDYIDRLENERLHRLYLEKIFSNRNRTKNNKKIEKEPYTPNAFINTWINEFGIGDAVSLEMDSEGLGVSIKLQKGDNTTLLADEGFGISQLFSILLEIETRILMQESHPFVLDQTIIIEEPEIHLHPNFQSKLVDMFAEAMEKHGIHFMIETHSEYFIRRLQLRVAEKKVSVDDVSVIYVDDKSNPYNMGLRANGKFSRDFGSGFLDEADNAAIQLFELSLN